MNKNTTKIIIAVVLLCIAGVAILFQLGVIGGSEAIPDAARAPERTGTEGETGVEDPADRSMGLPPPPTF